MPISALKRPADNNAVAVIPQAAKRTRNDEIQTYKDKQLSEIGIIRNSNLFSPIMKLEGHESDIFTCEFHPDGELLGKLKPVTYSEPNTKFIVFLASSGFDRKVFLWTVYGEECNNVAVMAGQFIFLIAPS